MSEPREIVRGGISDKKTLIKTLQDTNRKLRNKQLERMQVEVTKNQAKGITEFESSRAELAGQLIAQNIAAASGPIKLNAVTGHPDYKKIETELIITRGSDIEGMCRRWKIYDKSGELAVAILAKHYGGMRRRYSRAFESLDLAAREKMANSFLSKIDEMYDLSKAAFVQAMNHQKHIEGVGMVNTPEYEAAGVMMDKMHGATTLLGAALERQDKKEAESSPYSSSQAPMMINGPVGRIQILGLPKAIPQKTVDSDDDLPIQKALPSA